MGQRRSHGGNRREELGELLLTRLLEADLFNEETIHRRLKDVVDKNGTLKKVVGGNITKNNDMRDAAAYGA